jgi:hypothetical protein
MILVFTVGFYRAPLQIVACLREKNTEARNNR